MSIRSDPLDRLQIPDGTTVEEHDLVAKGDVVVGGQSTVEFGVRGRNVYAGERVRFGGDIEADGECRLDVWCDVGGNVLVGGDAYLGERVHVAGQLIVSGDLDIGDDVDIEDGFEANGWIVIRNPMPTIVFLFVYLSQLLRLGRDEDAEEVVDEFLTDDREHEPVLVPRGARVSDDAWQVSTPAQVGADCRLHGNLRAESIDVGRGTELFGSLRAKGDITVAPDAVIHGDVTTRGGDVTIAEDAHVRGDVACENLDLHDDAEVDGAIRARGAMNITREPADDDAAADAADDADAGTGTDAAADDPAARSDDPARAIETVAPSVGPREVPDDTTPAVRRATDPDDGVSGANDLTPAIRRVDDGEESSADDAAADADDTDDGDGDDADDPGYSTSAPEPATNGHGLSNAIAEAEKR
ncbi:polymer-forming cytoskeletal protein [Haloglomus litoreum]|uniref:polymer-forming cytoskeletal protein n=1 Tax=Haloglomus litoreum TaxID=3034026 RepID=UPI0023E78506|nr:polymer-forming cytoskeletal protein [Haloglomus sp. DT116]